MGCHCCACRLGDGPSEVKITVGSWNEEDELMWAAGMDFEPSVIFLLREALRQLEQGRSIQEQLDKVLARLEATK